MRDIGANLAGKQFVNDLDEVITRAHQAGVEFIDITGTDIASSRRAIELARARPGSLGATAGVHPHGARLFDATAMHALRDMLAQPEVLMCGEMGLDYARNYSLPAQQRAAFEAQLDLADEINKPLFLHCRDAFDDFVSIMDRKPGRWKRAIVHCFTGVKDEARAYVERGAYIGITGWIADKRRNAPLLGAMKSIPLSRLLLETDAPYLMPGNKPKSQTRDRNEPANLPWVAQAVAESLGVPEDEVASAALANADQLIGRGPAYVVSKTPSRVSRLEG